MTHSWFPTLALAVQPISTTSDSQVAHTQDYQGAFEPDWAIKEKLCLLTVSTTESIPGDM